MNPRAAKKMADVARQVIGNPALFDLNFRTARIAELKGQPLDDAKIHTYCAGILMLCAQETDIPCEQFFPIAEGPAEGQTEPNLAHLGMTFGDDFISPTGALFSPALTVVGSRKPMYEPNRQVQEAVYDHFAKRLVTSEVALSRTTYQSLREKLAAATKDNPTLARAIASALDIHEDMDLVAGAKAAALVETLDEIALGAADGFSHARRALRAGNDEQLVRQGFNSTELTAIEAYRKRHSELYQGWTGGRVSPRALRLDLVDFYSSKGQREIDQRFFGDASKP